MIRPEVLYRGSPRQGVKEFVPKERLGDHQVVSATSERMIATKFVIPPESVPFAAGSFQGIHYYVCADEEGLRKVDQGGAIYSFPSDDFELTPEIGPEIWTSPKPVKPTSEEDVTFGLEAMMEAGVQVYFVSTETFEVFRQSSPEQRVNLLQSLVSENMRPKRDIQSFPDSH